MRTVTRFAVAAAAALVVATAAAPAALGQQISPSPESASPRALATPLSGGPCQAASFQEVAVDPTAITATGAAVVTASTMPNGIVDLYAYTRPSTAFIRVRSAETGAEGTATFTIKPPSNTRLHSAQRGCENRRSPSVVLNVRTALTLAVERNGTRNYTFSGDSLPARPGGLIVSLYRVTDDGRQVLTSQARASATDGEWEMRRQFTGVGRFGFVVRTGQDLQNAPGSSNVRSLLIF